MLNHPLNKSHYHGIVDACSDDTAHHDLQIMWQGVKKLTTTRANLVENPSPLAFLGGFAYDDLVLAPARQTIPGVWTAFTVQKQKARQAEGPVNSDLE